ncbi:hypothetical protein GCM10010483_47580 [Actinokineospora diospyrosa]
MQAQGSADGKPTSAPSEATKAAVTGTKKAIGTGVGQLPVDSDELPPQPAVEQPKTQVRAGAKPTTGTKSFDPRFSRELENLRDARTRVYANPDGTRTAQVSTLPEFYKASNGSWQPIDGNLVEDGAVLRNKAGAVGHRFAKRADAAALAEYRISDTVSVGFGVTGAKPSSGTKDADQVTYPDVRQAADLEFQSTATGIKETIVLKGADAPTEWVFPLDLRGLTARLDNGSVSLVDGAGAVRATIPRGFMEDSAFPQAGTGVNSDKVTYALDSQGGKTVLRVSVDKAWVTDPARVFPIRVDPSVVDVQADASTFVQTGFTTPHHTMAEVRTGTWDGGSNKAATYLNFGSVSSQLAGQYVVGAELWLANIHSFSCSPRDVRVHQVTQPWSANQIAGFPGPGYGAQVGSANFAYAYSGAGSACPNTAWVPIPLNQTGRDLVNSWTHGAANYGLTVRSSETDSYAWKKFASRNSANPPKLAVTYSPYWATYQVPQSMSVPVSSTQDGVMPITVTNWGRDVWTPGNNYQLTYHLYNSSGVEQPQSMTYHVAVPHNVGYGQSATIQMPIKKLAPGNWTIQFDMDLYGTTMFAWQGVPTSGTVALTIGDQYPIITGLSPEHYSSLGTLTPTLTLKGYDPDNYPSLGTAGRFVISDLAGTTVADSGWVGDGTNSGFSGTVNWTVPAGVLKWSQVYRWSASIGSWGNNGPMVGGYTFTTAVPQPAVLYRGGAATLESDKGFDPLTRNYTTVATDAAVKSVGPDLSVVRTYNSLDSRNLAFGKGWASRFDSAVLPDSDGSGNLVVYYPDGQQVRFGRNSDGTFAPPPGRFATMTPVSGGGWRLIDKANLVYTFTAAGKLATITDGHARSITLTYDGSNKLTTVTNSAGGRALRFTWTGNHIATITTDPVTSGGTGLVWTYTYDGDALTKVCDPTAVCTTYENNPGPEYYDRVIKTVYKGGYWTLADAGGSSAVNEIPGGSAAAAANVTAASDNPFGLAGVNSASFNGTTSVLTVPSQAVRFDDPATTTHRFELWFKATGSAGGVLIGGSTSAHGAAGATSAFQTTYVGTDGKLYVTPAGSGSLITGPVVTDGKWHLLTLGLNKSANNAVYVDGVKIGTTTGALPAGAATATVFVGAGPISGSWPAKPVDPWAHFSGSLAHLSTNRDVSWSEVGTNFGYGSTTRLRSILDGTGHRLAQVYYVDGTGKAARVVDRNGGTWQLSSPLGNGMYEWDPWGKPDSNGYEISQLAVDSGWFQSAGEGARGEAWPGRLLHIGGPVQTTVTGPMGDLGLRFDGLNHGAAFSTASEVAGASTATVEMWFRTSTTTGGVLLGEYTSIPEGGLRDDDTPLIYVGSDGKLYGHFNNGQVAGIVTPNAVNDGQWHHLVLTADGAGQAMYLDAALVGTLAGSISSDATHVEVAIGTFDARPWPARPASGFSFLAVDVAHLISYRSALPAARVSAHYAARGSLTSFRGAVYPDVPHQWRLFNDVDEPKLDPALGGATLVNVPLDQNPFITDGGGSGSFNGSTSHAVLPPYHLLGRGKYSVDLWFQSSSVAGGVLLGAGNKNPAESGTPTGRPLLYIGTDGKLYGGLAPTGVDPMRSTAPVNDGQWHHAAITSDGTSQVLYLDGKAVGHRSGSAAIGDRVIQAGVGWLADEAWPSEPADSWGHFNGTISYLNFYPRALTSSQVLTHVREGYAKSYSVTVVDPAGRKIVYGFDHDRGDRLAYKVDAKGAAQHYEYDAGGFLAKVTDANGNATNTGYDAQGNLVSQSTCRAQTQCNTAYYGYYANPADPADPRNGLLLTSRDARSANKDDTTYLTTYTYTAEGELASVRTPSTDDVPDGRASTNLYTAGTEAAPAGTGGGTQPKGLLASTTDPAGGVTSFAYNRFGDLVSATDPAGKITRYTYDGLGRPVTTEVVSSALPGGASTSSTTYDGASRVLTSTGPVTTDAVTGVTRQSRVLNTYHGNGALATSTSSDVNGTAIARTTSYDYDDRGRVRTVTDAEGGVTTYTHDTLGNRTKVVDPVGTEFTYTYTPTNQLATTGVKSFSGDGQPARDVTLESNAYDPAGRLATTTDAMGRTTAYRYFDDGLLATQTRVGFREANGSTRDVQIAAFDYDAVGNQTRTTAGGVVAERVFDAAGYLVASVGDPQGEQRTTRYTVDGLGNPVTVTSTDSDSTTPTITTLGYDAVGRETTRSVVNGATTLVTKTVRDQSGLVTAVTDPRGTTGPTPDPAFTTNYAYDAAGRLTTVTQPPGSLESNGAAAQVGRPVTKTGYDVFGAATSVRDPNGNTTTAAYDKLGRQTSTTAPAYTPPGGTAITPTTTTTYDGAGRTSSVTDAGGATTTFGYDVLGNLTLRTDPVRGTDPAGVSTFRYTPLGELLSATGVTGATTTATYDDLGRRITETVVERYPAPGRNLTTTTAYNDSGTVKSVKTPDGAETKYAYNGLAEQVSSTNPQNKVTTFAYDHLGRTVKVTDPLGLSVGTQYDQAGRQVAVTQSNAAGQVLRTTGTGYDRAGNVTSSTNALNVTTTIAVDALGRLVSETQPVATNANTSVGYGYDAAGNRTRLTDGNGNATITKFNTWNLVESVIEPVTPQHSAASNRTWTTSYDVLGRPVRLLQPGNVVRNRVFDVFGNLTNETGTGTVATTAERVLGYDLAGRLTSAKSGSGTNNYTYDDRGNLLSMAGPSGNATYAYDDNGRLTSRADAAGTATFTYTSAGRLLSAADPRTGATATYGYDDAGRSTSVGYGSGNGSRAYAWDDLNRLVSDKVKNPAGTDTATITYGYDVADRLTSKATTGTAGAASNTYGYDLAGRLTTWTNGATTTGYTWDNAGNRLTAGAVSYTYNQRNRLVTAGSTTYDFTARGALEGTTTGGVTTTYRFDAFDRLAIDGSRTYAYDSLDRLIKPGMSYSDLGNDLAADGTATYSRLPNGDLLGLSQGAASGLALTDQHDDLVATYSAAGAIVDSTAYNPFGEVLARTGSAHPLGFQSGWTDDVTGRVNMAARWYNPATATFYSRDDIAGAGGPGVAGHNRFAYGAASPMNYNDPDGHLAQAVCVAPTLATAAAPPVAVAVGATCVVGTTLLEVAAWAGVATVGTGISYLADSAINGTTGSFRNRLNVRPRFGSDRPDEVINCRSLGGCGGSVGPRTPPAPIGTQAKPGGGGAGGGPKGPRGPGGNVRVTTRNGNPGGGGGGPTAAALAAAAAAAMAAKVLEKALTPTPKPPSGPTLAPDVQKLIADAGTILASVVTGQTIQQTALADRDDRPIPSPDPGSDPRGPGGTGTDEDEDDGCRENWQQYGERQQVTYNGRRALRATWAAACVVSTNSEERPVLGFALPGQKSDTGMARCHLIAHSLNGSSSDRRNFVPCYQDKTNNAWMWHGVEKIIGQQVEAKNPVHMIVAPVYDEFNTMVPYAIKFYARGNNGWLCHGTIPNMSNFHVELLEVKFEDSCKGS